MRTNSLRTPREFLYEPLLSTVCDMGHYSDGEGKRHWVSGLPVNSLPFLRGVDKSRAGVGLSGSEHRFLPMLGRFGCVQLCDTRLLSPWDSPGKNTRVDCHAFLQGIFPTQGSNSCLFLFLLHLSTTFGFVNLGKLFNCSVSVSSCVQ